MSGETDGAITEGVVMEGMLGLAAKSVFLDRRTTEGRTERILAVLLEEKPEVESPQMTNPVEAALIGQMASDRVATGA